MMEENYFYGFSLSFALKRFNENGYAVWFRYPKNWELRWDGLYSLTWPHYGTKIPFSNCNEMWFFESSNISDADDFRKIRLYFSLKFSKIYLSFIILYILRPDSLLVSAPNCKARGCGFEWRWGKIYVWWILIFVVESWMLFLFK